MKNIVTEALNPKHGNINYLSELRELTRKNRANPTKAESIIWQEVLRYKKTGYKFTRQKPINRFILDFYCAELNLAIEIDGCSHESKKAYDNERDDFLKQIGIETIRFENDKILNNIELVKEKIKKILPPLSRGGVPPKAGRRG